jgi:hypothetical protein
MKTIFFILLVLSSFAFSYEAIENTFHTCEGQHRWCLSKCEYGYNFANALKDPLNITFDIDSTLQVCKNKCQEELLQCLKTKTNNN